MAAINGIANIDTSSAVSPSTFSYAQAAKGKKSSSSSPVQLADTPSMSSKASKESVSSPSLLSSKDGKFNWADDAADATTVVDDRAQGEESVVQMDTQASPKSMVNGTNGDDVSHASSSDTAATKASSTAKDDQYVPTFADPEALSWRRRPKESESVQESHEDLASRKSDPEETPKENPQQKHLVEAPVPTVNFWTQRAQGAKSRPSKVPTINVPKKEPASAPTSSVPGPSPAHTGTDTSVAQPTPEEVRRSPVAGDVNRRASYPRTNGPGPAPQARNTDTHLPSTDTHSTKINGAQGTVKQSPTAPLVDAQLWPTPDTVHDKDRQRVQEKTDKSEEKVLTPARPHTKAEKWVTVPFTPTVKFETPLPALGARRGGKLGARGGRENGARGGVSHATAKTEPTDASVPDEPNSRSAVGSSASRSSQSPKRRSTGGAEPNDRATAKRSSVSNEQPQSSRVSEPRSLPRQLNSAPASAVESTGAFDMPRVNNAAGGQSRAPPGPPETNSLQHEAAQQAPADFRPRRKGSRGADVETIGFRNGDRKRSGSINGNYRGGLYERRADTFPRSYESREAHPSFAQRERGESRAERSRGGRTRGGLAPHLPSMLQQTNTSPISPNGPQLSARSAIFQQGYTGGFSGQRTMRGNTHRPASLPSDAAFSRYAPTYPEAQPFTPFANGGYDYNAVPQISPATQYNPYMSQMMLLNGVAGQLNYYFSVDNLCKDMFLRQHMDSQGFVPLKFIADFARMKVLTTDLDVVRTVAEQSPDYHLCPNSEGHLLIRKSVGWEKFVLAKADRDATARHDGPPTPSVEEPVVEQSTSNGRYHPAEAMFTPVPTTVSEYSQALAVTASPTSALPGPEIVAAPDVPVAQTPAALEQAVIASSPDQATEELDTFPDDKIDHLTVVVRPRAPFHCDASRSFSNGSLDDGIPSGERQSRSLVRTNGVNQQDHSTRIADIKKSLASPSSSHKSPAPKPSSLSVFWIKEQGEEPDQLPPNSTYEPYGQVCANATEQRRSAPSGHCPYDMNLLYQFWSHFLLRNFNTRMYVDFRTFAHEDAAQGSKVGLDNLIKYYGESMLSPRTMRKTVAQDYVDLVNSENVEGERSAFKQLRAMWRNGAFNMKNRKIISDLINRDLQTELDR